MTKKISIKKRLLYKINKKYEMLETVHVKAIGWWICVSIFLLGMFIHVCLYRIKQLKFPRSFRLVSGQLALIISGITICNSLTWKVSWITGQTFSPYLHGSLFRLKLSWTDGSEPCLTFGAACLYTHEIKF